MNLPQIIRELQEAVGQIGLRVRVERGRFRGGRCQVNGEDLIVLNKRHPPEQQFAVLARALRETPMENLYVKPAVRRALEEAWDRQDRGLESEAGSETEDD